MHKSRNRLDPGIRKIKNRERFKETVLARAMAISFSVLTISGVLDYFFGNEILQRCGAIIVGFSILISYYHTQVSIIIANNKNALKTIGALRSQIANATDKTFAALIIQMANAIQKQQPDIDQSTAIKNAAVVYSSFRGIHERTPKLEETADAYQMKEVFLATIGTGFWAFGDWVTNFLFHCDWAISCPPCQM